MEINNAEQQLLFGKLDEIKKEIESGVFSTYSSSNFYGNFVEGYETFFDEEKKRPHKYFMYDYGTNNGRFCEYSDEGPEKQMMTYDSDGRLRIEDFKDGLIYEEMSYKNGKKEGYYLKRHPNGKVQEEGFYKDGLRHGECTDYQLDGTPIRHAEYQNGILDGNCTDYYENGKIKEVVSYKNGQKDGLCDLYDLDGNITSKFYIEGQDQGSLPSFEPLVSTLTPFSFDQILSSVEKMDEATDEKSKSTLSQTLSSLQEIAQASVEKTQIVINNEKINDEALQNQTFKRHSSIQDVIAPSVPNISQKEQGIIPPKIIFPSKDSR
ncbi:MAG: toxin-antitoxin system YwqK family antitoxin [Alphaproteobacteria bacterium]|nr:toxin-antitoxin system YwqK family antitoxin [Alphaproteobacteria bacterium]